MCVGVCFPIFNRFIFAPNFESTMKSGAYLAEPHFWRQKTWFWIFVFQKNEVGAEGR